jgi:hypothetical protein
MHDWEPAAYCLYCGTWCPRCNDCTCPGAGWSRYANSSCPGFDTKAGNLRPSKAAVQAARNAAEARSGTWADDDILEDPRKDRAW